MRALKRGYIKHLTKYLKLMMRTVLNIGMRENYKNALVIPEGKTLLLLLAKQSILVKAQEFNL